MYPKFIRIWSSLCTVSPTEPLPHAVMPGLVPGISRNQDRWALGKRVDGRNESGHDVLGAPSIWTKTSRPGP